MKELTKPLFSRLTNRSMKEEIDPKEQYEAEKWAEFGEKSKPKKDPDELEAEFEANQ